jgi:hypothetical protein
VQGSLRSRQGFLSKVTFACGCHVTSLLGSSVRVHVCASHSLRAVRDRNARIEARCGCSIVIERCKVTDYKPCPVDYEFLAALKGVKPAQANVLDSVKLGKELHVFDDSGRLLR